LRKEFGCRPAARANPLRLASPESTRAVSLSIRVVDMARRYHIRM
jgi:hypothetical protein